MATLRSTLTVLAALHVPGAVHNYDVDTVPDSLSRAQLPALLLLPAETPDESLIRGERFDRGVGFEAVAFGEGARTVTYSLTHLLLVAPVAAGRGLRSQFPALIDLIDAYFGALAQDVTLGGRLLEPARVRVHPGIFTHGGVAYYGCAFVHTWVMGVEE